MLMSVENDDKRVRDKYYLHTRVFLILSFDISFVLLKFKSYYYFFIRADISYINQRIVIIICHSACDTIFGRKCVYL